MKFFNEILQQKTQFFHISFLHYFIFPNYSHEVKKEEKRKNYMGFCYSESMANFEVVCQNISKNKNRKFLKSLSLEKNTKTLVEMLILQFSEDNLRGTAKFISLKNYQRREERKKYQINDIGFLLFLFLRFALFFKMSQSHSHLFWTKN